MALERALDVESKIFIVHATRALYLLAVKRILFNLMSNPSLHTLDVDTLVYMSDEDMARGTVVECVQHQERARHDAYVNLLKEKEAAANDQQAGSIIHCRRCHSANLSFVQVQTRSADEAMSVFMTCNNCANRWRMS